MERKRTNLGLMVVAILAGAGTAAAQTPDEETPAVETVCDVLQGATPALYGLCVAYCEAADCTFENFMANACTPPNPNILVNYNRRKQAGDPDMPCIRPVCPCFDAQDLQAIGGVRCQDEATLADISNGLEACGSGATAVFSSATRDIGKCAITLQQGDRDRCTRIKVFNQAPLPDAVAQACMDLIVEEAARLGLTCK